jgi:hypothetical protein
VASSLQDLLFPILQGMLSQITMETFLNIDDTLAPLDEPHFDDELTLVTAQPVVPLELIAAEQTRKKRWLLAGAFALSLLLGAGSALLAIRIKRQVSEPVVVDSALTEESVPTKNEDSAQILGGETPVLAARVEELEPLESEEEEPVAAAISKGAERNQSKKVVTAHRNTTRNQPVKQSVDDNDSKQESARLVDQWEERRARRVSKRDRRERRQRQDLFRIGDIFEGSRPRRHQN